MRRGAFGEWLRTAHCPQSQGSWGPDALEVPKGGVGSTCAALVILLGTSQLGQGWGRVGP